MYTKNHTDSHNNITLVTIATVDTSRPSLKDLYRCVTPNYATKWKTIGTLLGLSSERLNIIQYDHTEAEPCCNAMLKYWLQADTDASWSKLMEAISAIPGKAFYILYIAIAIRILALKFSRFLVTSSSKKYAGARGGL